MYKDTHTDKQDDIQETAIQVCMTEIQNPC